MSGDNSELTAQLEEMKQNLADKEAELEKYKGMHQADQDHINKLGNEVGEYRKKLDALADKVEGLEVKKEVTAPNEEGKKTPEEIEAEEKRKQEEAVKAESNRLKGILTEEDDAALNELYDSADPEVQAAIDSDPAVEAKFLQNYLGERAVPKRSWRGTTEKTTENRSGDIFKRMDAMFNRNKKESNFSPVSSGESRFIPSGRGAVETEERTSKNLEVLGVGGRDSATVIGGARQGAV